jgi:hypothetical protein
MKNVFLPVTAYKKGLKRKKYKIAILMLKWWQNSLMLRIICVTSDEPEEGSQKVIGFKIWPWI